MQIGTIPRNTVGINILFTMILPHKIFKTALITGAVVLFYSMLMGGPVMAGTWHGLTGCDVVYSRAESLFR